MEKINCQALKYSEKFTLKILKGLRQNGLDKGFYICGSILRHEALPMSDIDIVYFSSKRRIKINEIDGLDRLDDLKLSDRVAKQLYKRMSPEVGFLDSKPIKGKNHKYYKWHNEQKYLLNRFIWGYIYYRLFNERSDPNNKTYNLKYSAGAYRDILLINWFARIVGSTNYKGPEIIHSLKEIKRITKISVGKNILESINFIMLTKSTVLAAHLGAPSKGRTQLNNETLKESLKFNSYFARQVKNNPHVFWKRYLDSKKQISLFLDVLFKYARERYGNMIYDFIRLSIDLSQKTSSKINIKSILKNNNYNRFPVYTCLINNKFISSGLLNELALKCVNDPGHYYTNRLIAKSPKAAKNTLKFLLNKSRFAIDEWTNNRYKEIISKRLKNEKN